MSCHQKKYVNMSKVSILRRLYYFHLIHVKVEIAKSNINELNLNLEDPKFKTINDVKSKSTLSSFQIQKANIIFIRRIVPPKCNN